MRLAIALELVVVLVLACVLLLTLVVLRIPNEDQEAPHRCAKALLGVCLLYQLVVRVVVQVWLQLSPYLAARHSTHTRATPPHDGPCGRSCLVIVSITVVIMIGLRPSPHGEVRRST